MDAIRLLVTLLLPYFPPSVQAWEHHVAQWAYQYDLSPALIMTFMQLESCGNPFVVSGAGAAGLFQVMPFHFAAGENRLDPMTNAHRGLTYLKWCSEAVDGDLPSTLACYNGGLTRARSPMTEWPSETQRFVFWGSRLLARVNGRAYGDPIYDWWWERRGQHVCALALRILSDDL